MSDLNTNTATPAPASAATPPVQAKPAATANGNGKGGKQIRIPQAAFKSRIEREAAAIVKRKLGVSIEDAEKLVRAGGGGVASAAQPTNAQAAVAATVSNAEAELRAENARLLKKAQQAEKLATDWQNKHRKDVTRLKDKQIEAELRMQAVQAGAVDPDYAVTLFARAAASGKANEPAQFFTGLKTSHAFLFGAQAAPTEPVTVAATTAPPESQQPGEAKPSPAAAGTPAPAVNADSMSPQDFNRHLRSYGYSPGM